MERQYFLFYPFDLLSYNVYFSYSVDPLVIFLLLSEFVVLFAHLFSNSLLSVLFAHLFISLFFVFACLHLFTCFMFVYMVQNSESTFHDYGFLFLLVF